MFAQRMEANRIKVSPSESKLCRPASSPDPATPSLVSLKSASTPASRSPAAPGGLAARLAAASSEQANGDAPKKGLGALMAAKGGAQGVTQGPAAKPSLWAAAGSSGLAQHKLTREKSFANLITAAKAEAKRRRKEERNERASNAREY